jgi:hypothetical protein
MSTTRTETTEQNKATLVAAMKQFGIDYIHVAFDGCGDSGQMEEVQIFDENAKEIASDCLNTPYEVAYTNHIFQSGKWDHERFTRMETLRNLAEEVAYAPLEDHFGGWEINEGAYGIVVINADGTGRIEINQRVVEVEEDSATF